jgi:hypothetical protein
MKQNPGFTVSMLVRAKALMRTTYIWIAAPLLFLGLFLKLTFELREDSDVTVVDERMLTAISTIRSPHLTNIAVDFTALGSVSVIATFSVLAVLLLLMFGQRRSAVLLSIVSASSGVATYLFKHVFSRARPDSLIPVDIRCRRPLFTVVCFFWSPGVFPVFGTAC